MRRFLPGFVKRGLKAVGLRAVDKLREWTRPNNNSLVSGAVADATRSKSELMLENALLRQQVIVLDRQVNRPVLSWRERGIMVLLAGTPPGTVRQFGIEVQGLDKRAGMGKLRVFCARWVKKPRSREK
jgi:hypothetical protein